jgi:uncharacterized protein YndB with AHSA1/START domain
VRQLWVHRTIEAPAERLWELLTDLESWPHWGPSVRSATLDGPFAAGTRGTVTTAVGARLPFEITAFDPPHRWSWTVAGVPATDHAVEDLDGRRCRVGFGVPWVAAPYLGVCAVALHRLDRRATPHPS